MKTNIKYYTITLLLISLLAYSAIGQKKQRPSAIRSGKFFTVDGNKMLYGGPDKSQHFNINNLMLDRDQFHYGLGREVFPALLEPTFVTIEAADQIWSDEDRFLVAFTHNEAKVYAIKDLIRHEIVNDELDGKPIMAAYCILADLGAIYDRQYGEQTMTFALSGYTYYDEGVWNGLDGFVFWDRETESLWWPLIGQAVSGPLKNVKLMVTDESQWKDTTWKVVKEEFPNARVLKSGQDFERPTTWDKLTESEINTIVSNYRIKK